MFCYWRCAMMIKEPTTAEYLHQMGDVSDPFGVIAQLLFKLADQKQAEFPVCWGGGGGNSCKDFEVYKLQLLMKQNNCTK